MKRKESIPENSEVKHILPNTASLYFWIRCLIQLGMEEFIFLFQVKNTLKMIYDRSNFRSKKRKNPEPSTDSLTNNQPDDKELNLDSWLQLLEGLTIKNWTNKNKTDFVLLEINRLSNCQTPQAVNLTFLQLQLKLTILAYINLEISTETMKTFAMIDHSKIIGRADSTQAIWRKQILERTGFLIGYYSPCSTNAVESSKLKKEMKTGSTLENRFRS